MANYLLVYQGTGMPASAAADPTVVQAWTDWFTALGPAVVDPGNPASQTKHIGTDGSVSAEAGPTGYSIIKADSIDAAIELAKGCPVLLGGNTVQVVETFDAM
jgi:hypothetical protein